MDMIAIKRAMPPENGTGRRSVIRARSDVAEIAVDCVLHRRQFKEIAQRCGVDIISLDRFRKKYITPTVEKIIIAAANKQESDQLDVQVNKAQDKIEGGIEGILTEQKRLYKTLNDMVADKGADSLMEVLGPMMQLLRDQNKSYENLLKVYSNLKEKTTIVLSLNEHPDVAKLMDVLWVVFQQHPAAFVAIQQQIEFRKIPLHVVE